MQSITRQQFFGRYDARARNPRCAEAEALLDLNTPGGMAVPCRWRHFGRNVCSGASLMRHTAERYGFTVKTFCENGTLNVWKEARQ